MPIANKDVNAPVLLKRFRLLLRRRDDREKTIHSRSFRVLEDFDGPTIENRGEPVQVRMHIVPWRSSLEGQLTEICSQRIIMENLAANAYRTPVALSRCSTCSAAVSATKLLLASVGGGGHEELKKTQYIIQPLAESGLGGQGSQLLGEEVVHVGAEEVLIPGHFFGARRDLDIDGVQDIA